MTQREKDIELISRFRQAVVCMIKPTPDTREEFRTEELLQAQERITRAKLVKEVVEYMKLESKVVHREINHGVNISDFKKYKVLDDKFRALLDQEDI